MPDEKEPLKEENLLSGLMKQVVGSEGGNSPSSFPVTMVLIGIVTLIISFMGIKLALAKRKAAQLAVQVRRSEEEKKRIKEEMQLAENSEKRQAAQEEIQELTKEILGLKAQIAKRQAAHLEYVDGLKGVTSWDDIVVVDSRDEK